MQIQSMLEDKTPVAEMLRDILHHNALNRFKFAEHEMGFGNGRLRTGFILAIETFSDSTNILKVKESRDLRDLFDEGPPSISPLVVNPHGVFWISTVLKYKLHKALSSRSANVSDTTRLEMLLDSISYGCHLVSSKVEMSYRDHYVHPIAVAALGVHILLHGRKPLLGYTAERLWNSEDGKRLLEACAANGIPCLDRDLEADVPAPNAAELWRTSPVELRRTSFVLLAWIIAAVYHDIGRHLIAMAQLQALNSYEKGARMLPVFHSYVSRSCFSRKSKVLKVCARSYPREEYLGPFLQFVERVCPSAFPKVKDKLRKGKLAASIKGMGRKDHPDDLDHAFLSSLELFTWASIIEKDIQRKSAIKQKSPRLIITALRLASASVLIHHLGSKEETKEALSKITTFEQNPLGVLLRVLDFFHSACRPFLIKYESKVSGNTVQYHNMQFDLQDTANLIALKPNRSHNPLAFTFRIRSRLAQALANAADDSSEYKHDKKKRDEFVTKEVNKFINETKTLDKWLKDIKTGVELDVKHLDINVLSE